MWAHLHAHVACVAAAAPDLRDGQGGITSLMLASQNGHVEAMMVLIDKGANLEAVHTVPIHSYVCVCVCVFVYV
jgi:hypothetical protein